jgi:flagellar biosynthesis anti-sigma factor FlgM
LVVERDIEQIGASHTFFAIQAKVSEEVDDNKIYKREKGKLPERGGRKATGLSPEHTGYGRRVARRASHFLKVGSHRLTRRKRGNHFPKETIMEAADNRPFVDFSLLQFCTNISVPFFMSQPKRNGKLGTAQESASFFPQESQSERVVALVTRGDELRADKVRRIKAQIAQGTYYVDTEAVAKSMLRSEIARLLGKN